MTVSETADHAIGDIAETSSHCAGGCEERIRRSEDQRVCRHAGEMIEHLAPPFRCTTAAGASSEPRQSWKKCADPRELGDRHPSVRKTPRWSITLDRPTWSGGGASERTASPIHAMNRRDADDAAFGQRNSTGRTVTSMLGRRGADVKGRTLKVSAGFRLRGPSPGVSRETYAEDGAWTRQAEEGCDDHARPTLRRSAVRSAHRPRGTRRRRGDPVLQGRIRACREHASTGRPWFTDQ
jgi:hypothetical protein